MTCANQAKDDTALMAQIAQGDHAAYAALVSRHNVRFFRLAYRLTGRSEDAEDILQEAFIHLWQAPHMWGPTRGSRFTTWFYQVISNRALNMRRRSMRYSVVELAEVEDGGMDAEAALSFKRRRLWLEERIRALPDRQRLALILCFYEDLSNQEAADIMGIGLKALQSLLMRAKATLKDDMICFDELKTRGRS